MKNKLLYLIFCFATIGCEYESINELNEEKKFNIERLNTIDNIVVSNNTDNLPIKLPPNFIWGVNGHPLTQSSYRDNGSEMSTQKSLLNEFRFTNYRVDFETSEYGEILHPYQQAKFDEMISTFSEKIKILPVLIFRDFDFVYSQDEMYQKGKLQGSGFASRYGKHFDYIVMGNEEELRCRDKKCTSLVIDKGAQGNLISQYNFESMVKIGAFLKGMSDGIKEHASHAKLIINCGAGHSGFLKFMDSYQYKYKKIQYDIAGLHWYHDWQNIQELSYEYSKPVWITEANRFHGSSVNNSINGQIPTQEEAEQAQVSEVTNLINQLNGAQKIEAFFMYELYDEPYLEPGEAHYGITKWYGSYEMGYNNDIQFDEYTHKPVSEVLKFKIEETTYGFEDYVYHFYNRVNLSVFDFDGLKYWTSEFQKRRNKQLFLTKILPERSYKLFVNDQYKKLLGRDSDAGGSNYWTEQMKNGLSREDLIVTFCTSTEFNSNSGFGNIGYVRNLYKTLLNREPNKIELMFWLSQLGSGVSKASVVNRFITQTEYLESFIKDQYVSLLAREGDISGLKYWVDRMQKGLNQQDLIIEFLMSKEFWDQSIIEGYERRMPFPYTYN